MGGSYMNTRDRIFDSGDRIIEMAKHDIEALSEHLEGPPPGASALTREEHMAWMEKTIAEAHRAYPPQMYMTPDGPQFGSLWMLTRKYVDGWPEEFKRYQRELQVQQEGEVAQ